MTLHLHMKHTCSKCETHYIPYNSKITCPKCGDKPEMEDYPEFIDGICESFLFNLKQDGKFSAMCWATMDQSDEFQMFLFGVFDSWMLEIEDHEPQNRAKAFEKYYNKTMDEVDLHGADFFNDYIKALGFAVYNEFFNVRKIDPTNLKEKNE